MRVRSGSVWLLLCLVSLEPGLFGAEFDSHLRSATSVVTRDGISLATDVYRPARAGAAIEGRFPVVVFRSPYGKAGVRRDGEFLASHGYVVVAQDCRGRYESEGEFRPFVNDGLDGYDTIEWAAAQPWSNGRVGTSGASYLGWVQCHASMFRPPHLEAMFVEVAGADFFREIAYPGGAPSLGWPYWIVHSASTSPEATRNPEAAASLRRILSAPAEWWARPPRQREPALADFPDHLRIYRDFYDHAEYDSYWRQKGFAIDLHYEEMKDVPALFLSGWYDGFVEGTLKNFSELSRMKKSPQKLIIGPWPHAAGKSECGDVFFGAEAAMSQQELMVDWFDHWLKDRPLRRIGSEAAHYFRMGGGDGTRTASGFLSHGGIWRQAPVWPPADSRPVVYYLHRDGKLDTRPGADAEPSHYVFDPDHPVPTIGGRSATGGAAPSGPQDQVCSARALGCDDARPLKERTDVLSFETAPLTSPLEVTGPVKARLRVSSDAVDTDFTAKLMDVYPDGYAMLVCDGQIRMRYRNGSEKAELMVPGTEYDVAIELGSTSNLFGTGHRIRLDVSSSNFPKFEPNSNTGEKPGAWTRRVPAHNAVHHDGSHSSRVELPIVSPK